MSYIDDEDKVHAQLAMLGRGMGKAGLLLDMLKQERIRHDARQKQMIQFLECTPVDEPIKRYDSVTDLLRSVTKFDEHHIPIKNAELQTSPDLATMPYNAVIRSVSAYRTPIGWMMGSWKMAQYMADLQLIPLQRFIGVPKTFYQKIIAEDFALTMMHTYPALTYTRYKILEYIMLGHAHAQANSHS